MANYTLTLRRGPKGFDLAKRVNLVCSSSIRKALFSRFRGSSSLWRSQTTPERLRDSTAHLGKSDRSGSCCNPCAILSLCAQLTLLIPVRRQALQPAHKRTGLDECAHRRQSNVQVNEEVAPHKRLKCFPLTGHRDSPDAEKAGLESRLLRCGTWPLIAYFTLERETCLFQRASGTMSTPALHPGLRSHRGLQAPMAGGDGRDPAAGPDGRATARQ